MGSAPSHKQKDVRIPKWAREHDKFTKKAKYPYCRSTFPDCPEEIKPDFVANICKVCPIYRQR